MAVSNSTPPARRKRPKADPAAAAPQLPQARFRQIDGNVHAFGYRRSRSREQSLFVFGVARGGSTLLHNIIEDLAPYSRRKLLRVGSKFRRQGAHTHDMIEDVDGFFQLPGYVFGTFRWLPQRMYMPALATNKKILLVRDPRDMLVSGYYSLRESHSLPKGDRLRARRERTRERLQEINVDEYVRGGAIGVKAKYLRTMSLLTTKNLLLRRYEDIIFEKERFVTDIADFCEFDVPADEITKIAKKQDIFPSNEDTKQHIRQVKPRNFEAKLSPETIAEVNYELRAILSEFGYS